MQEAEARFVGLDPLAVEDELRDGALAGLRDDLFGCAGGVFDVDLGEGDGVRCQEALCFAAVTAPVCGVDEQAHVYIVADSRR